MNRAEKIFKAHEDINFLFLNQKGCLLGSDQPVTLPFNGGLKSYQRHIFKHFEYHHDQSVVEIGEVIHRAHLEAAHNDDEKEEDTKHPHHDIMIALAKNKNLKIQARIKGETKWQNTNTLDFNSSGLEFRIKPETITVGGFTDYPKPPVFTRGQPFFLAGSWFKQICAEGDWDDESQYLKELHRNNLVFATQEDRDKATEILTKILTGVTPNA